MIAKKKPAARTRFIALCRAQDHGTANGYRIPDKEGNVYHGTRRKAEDLAVDHFIAKHLAIQTRKVTIERDVKITVNEVA